ncbi:MAG TPA: transporter suffix domain-containing protein [Rubrobacter sp.]|nr:transporter suffix domain-containing protein [Rubrobacter sp.]
MSERQESRLEEDEDLRRSKKARRTRLLGIVLLVAAVLFWAAAPAVLLLPLSGVQKVWAGSAFLVLGEVAFWASAVVLGREAFRRYRRFFDPRDWSCKGLG